MMQIAHSPFILNVKSPGSQLSSRNNSPVEVCEVKSKQSQHRHRRVQSNIQSELPSILNHATIMGDKSTHNSILHSIKKTDQNSSNVLTPQKGMSKCQSTTKIQVTPVLANKSSFDFVMETKKSLQKLGRNFFVKTPAGSRKASPEKAPLDDSKSLKRAPSMKEKEFVQTLKAIATPSKQKLDLHLDLGKILNDTKHVLCRDVKNTFARIANPRLPEIEIDLNKPSPISYNNKGIKSAKIDLTRNPSAKKCSPSPNVRGSDDEKEQQNMDDLWRKVREQDYLMDEDEFFRRFLETDKLEFSFEKQMTMRRGNMFNPVATPEPQAKKYNVKSHSKLTVNLDATHFSNQNFLSTNNSSTKGSSKCSNFSGSNRTNEMSKESLKNLSKTKCIQEEPERLSFSSGSKSPAPCPSNKKITNKPKLSLKMGIYEEDVNTVVRSTMFPSKYERPAKFFL